MGDVIPSVHVQVATERHATTHSLLVSSRPSPMWDRSSCWSTFRVAQGNTRWSKAGRARRREEMPEGQRCASARASAAVLALEGDRDC
jgi:hypothetical protein